MLHGNRPKQFITARVAKVMFSHAYVCSTSGDGGWGRWHQMHHGIGHMDTSLPLVTSSIGHTWSSPPSPPVRHGYLPPPPVRPGHLPPPPPVRTAHPPPRKYGQWRAVRILLECILVLYYFVRNVYRTQRIARCSLEYDPVVCEESSSFGWQKRWSSHIQPAALLPSIRQQIHAKPVHDDLLTGQQCRSQDLRLQGRCN